MKTQLFNQQLNALRILERRNELLASNIANADTPNYKARDIDFAAALRGAKDGQIGLVTTNAMHTPATGSGRVWGTAEYRESAQPSADGNTVEADIEQAALAENSVQYQAALTFLNGQIRTLNLAIKGSE